MNLSLLPAAAVLFLSFAVCNVAVRGLVIWLKNRSILDHPVERSSHEVPTPRGGGLAVTGTLVVFWAMIHLAQPLPGIPVLMAALVVLGAVSFRDDLASLSAGLRLIVHVAAVAVGLVWLSGQGLVFQGLLPPSVDLALAALIWIGFLNFFNFMDGIDGISSVEAASIGVGIFLVGLVAAPPLFEQAELLLVLALIGAVLGFAIWNWHPAHIFLGDVGSVPLGYILGALLLGLAARGAWEAALILPLYYLADAGITLTRRILRGEKFWQAHRSHFYQRAVQRGMTHRQVSTAVAVANGALILLAVTASDMPVPALGLAVVVVLTLLFWMTKWPVQSASS